MRHIRLDVEYDGSRFAGFQRQGPDGPCTVQGELERALTALLNQEEVRTRSAGRTDRGVHALGQVVSFSTPSARPLEDLVRGANALLPPDIRALRAVEVPREFHPRFSALSRTYHYLILNTRRPDALLRERAWRVPRRLDLAAMNASARALVGEHDFSTYCADVPPGESRVRRLLELEVREGWGPGEDPLGRLRNAVVVTARAEAFLRRMVRMLAAALVLVGTGRWEEERPLRLLESRNNRLAPPPAPPWGLYLASVEYPAELGGPSGTRFSPESSGEAPLTGRA